jgi:hypothetical protein
MPVFISYSHHDSDFATRLATQLVRRKANVWIDQWELHVGDSILRRVELAIQAASALLIILSKTSVASEWCKTEISAGLLRELEEKRVVVLPVLLEDCDIPLLLRGKVYADFKTDFDKGLKAVLEAIARVTSESLGRVETPEWHTDWSLDYGFSEPDERFVMVITLVEHGKEQPYSVLTEIEITANDVATKRYQAFAKENLDRIQRATIFDGLASVDQERDLRIVLENEKPVVKSITLGDLRLGIVHQVLIKSRRVGLDTGRNILLDLGGQLKNIHESYRQAIRPLTREEIARYERLKREL